MSKWAMVENGVVVNLIEWDGDTNNWSPPPGIVMVYVGPDLYVDMGWLWDGAHFRAPDTP